MNNLGFEALTTWLIQPLGKQQYRPKANKRKSHFLAFVFILSLLLFKCIQNNLVKAKTIELKPICIYMRHLKKDVGDTKAIYH